MKVIGLCGWSGSGKTTLAEQLIMRLRHAGQRVSVVKHAHHAFDIDQPGKDSWRHREAGAFEVVIASNRRLAKLREYEVVAEPTAHQLIAELEAPYERAGPTKIPAGRICLDFDEAAFAGASLSTQRGRPILVAHHRHRLRLGGAIQRTDPCRGGDLRELV